VDRPLYSFEIIQSGPYIILDACVPFSVGCEVFELISAAAVKDRAPVATKRPAIKLASEPAFALLTVEQKRAGSKKRAAKSAQKAPKRRPARKA
jgi:hypothetical protein